MADFDQALLASTGRARPRVVILPTASFPDGEEVFTRWAAMGVAHFGALGAEVEPVMVRDRAGADDAAAAQAVGEADLIYLSGGKPAHLMDALDGTAVGRALAAAHGRGADPRRLFGRGHGPGRERLRLPAQPDALAAALARRAGVRSRCVGDTRTTTPGRSRSRCSSPSRRRVDRWSWGSTRRLRRWAETVPGRSTAGLASRSGAAATASAIAPGTRSGSSSVPRRWREAVGAVGGRAIRADPGAVAGSHRYVRGVASSRAATPAAPSTRSSTRSHRSVGGVARRAARSRLGVRRSRGPPGRGSDAVPRRAEAQGRQSGLTVRKQSEQ